MIPNKTKQTKMNQNEIQADPKQTKTSQSDPKQAK